MKHKEAEHTFFMKSGQAIKTLGELMQVLEDMSDEDFSHHVNENKNDFALWTEHSLHNKDLANKIRSAKTRLALLALLEHEFEEKPEAETPENETEEVPMKTEKKVAYEKSADVRESKPQIKTEYGKFVVKEFIYGLVAGVLLGVILSRLVFFVS
jgi:hypothetical protein